MITIDGPAAAGKSTLARSLAAELAVRYLNTGSLFRAVGLVALDERLSVTELAEFAQSGDVECDEDNVTINGSDVTPRLRLPSVTEAAVRIGHEPEIVAALIARQRSILAAGWYVADGRNLGTEVAPGAILKIYLTAPLPIRAERRGREDGEPASSVLDALRARDEADTTRPTGALRKAPDAILIDNGTLSPDEVLANVVGIAIQRGFSRR